MAQTKHTKKLPQCAKVSRTKKGSTSHKQQVSDDSEDSGSEVSHKRTWKRSRPKKVAMELVDEKSSDELEEPEVIEVQSDGSIAADGEAEVRVGISEMTLTHWHAIIGGRLGP
jgi:hypothetical protein